MMLLLSLARSSQSCATDATGAISHEIVCRFSLWCADEEGTLPAKYEPLELHLRAISSNLREVTLSFSEIERILGAALPESATTHRPWWANQRDSKSRPQAHAWLSAGFLVDAVNQGRGNGSVLFRRK